MIGGRGSVASVIFLNLLPVYTVEGGGKGELAPIKFKIKAKKLTYRRL